MKTAACVCLLALVLASCAGASTAPPTASPTVAVAAAAASPITTPKPSAAVSPGASPRPACPNRSGGECLGQLESGTYSTVAFRPTITYRVPSGWANYEDLPGNFLLLPPGADLAGVDAGTSDYVGIYSSVAADSLDCSGQPAPGVAITPKGIAAALMARPGIKATAPKSVVVGGLNGQVLDVTMEKGWTKSACSGDHPDVAMTTGVAPSDFGHSIGGTFVIRLYLLDTGTGVLNIEEDGLAGGKHLGEYADVVKALRFG